jgi:hypothetical protein
MRVFWKNRASPTIIAEAMTAAAMSIFWKLTSPPSISTSIEPLGRNSSLAIICFGSPPNTISPKPISM